MLKVICLQSRLICIQNFIFFMGAILDVQVLRTFFLNCSALHAVIWCNLIVLTQYGQPSATLSIVFLVKSWYSNVKIVIPYDW